MLPWRLANDMLNPPIMSHAECAMCFCSCSLLDIISGCDVS